ncbi:MAG: DUF1045 domain-containing protein [Alphaproteobacteria bacterium]
MVVRYAVYFVPPPDTPLGRFGDAWLGRSVDSGEAVAPPALNGLDAAELRAFTEAPRLYGWHATLKPPFALWPGTSETDLSDALKGLAARWAAFEAPPLVLRAPGQFLALVPAAPCAALDALAADCVAALDGFRRPPDAAELDRRRAAGLSARQEAMLARWGYPYVMEEFRFHMTLTDPLDAATRTRIEQVLAPLASRFADAPVRIDQLALCRQEAAGRPFRVVRRYALTGASESSSATNRETAVSTGASFSNLTTSGPLGA